MTQPPFDMTGRVALVTGASSGIGRRLSLKLAEAGARVCVGARRADRLGDLVGEIEAAGGRALAVDLDVLDEAAVIAAFDAAEAALGPVDTVYANAGMNVEARAVDISMADWD